LSKGSTKEDVKDGLEGLGDAFSLKPYAEAAAMNGINGDTLYAITEAEMDDLGIVIKSLHKRRMLKEIDIFRAGGGAGGVGDIKEDKDGAGASEVETLFLYLSSDRAKLRRDELEGHQVVLQAVGSDAKKATAGTVEALKTIEGTLREICLANGLADGEGGVVVQKVKKGVSRPMKLHNMGAYLTECEAMKAHLPKPLLTRLHKEIHNQFVHESGLLCEASKSLDFCLLGFELLEAVRPATGGSSSAQGEHNAQAKVEWIEESDIVPELDEKGLKKCIGSGSVGTVFIVGVCALWPHCLPIHCLPIHCC
jgi:hypothetical protein